jgi:hypothetical protein
MLFLIITGAAAEADLVLLQVINQGKKFSSTSLYSTYSEFRGPSAFQANGFLTARLLNRLNQDLTGGP